MDFSAESVNGGKTSQKSSSERRGKAAGRNRSPQKNSTILKVKDKDEARTCKRSPRKQTSSIRDQSVGITQEVKEVMDPSSSDQSLKNLRKYRIPKRSALSNGGTETVLDVKVPQKEISLGSVTFGEPVLTQNARNNIPKCSSSSKQDLESAIDININVTKLGKAREKRNPHQNRPKVLQAKRRLAHNSTNDHKEANFNIQQKQMAITSSSSNKFFEDLPDYEDVNDDEDDDNEVPEDLNNPIPKILKMVKDSEGTVHLDLGPSEVTAMDIDIDLPSPPEQTIVVADTNIWINDLTLIENIVNKEFSKPVVIVIPWMVLQELDVGMHQKTKPGQSLLKMKRPIQYIHKLLASNHPKIKGQKAYEAAISKLKFDELVADDSILNCVLQNLKSNNNVIFLSNDKNLLNKALVHGIISCSSRDAMTRLDEIIDGKIAPTPGSLFPPTLSHSSNLPIKRRLTSVATTTEALDYILDNDVEMQDAMSSPSAPLCKVRATGQTFSSEKPESGFQVIETALLKAFSYIIKRKMIEDYGMGGWEYALKIKPPWTLSNAIKCMMVHWIANFSFVFSRKGQKHLENLKPLVDNYRSARIDGRKRIEDQIMDSSISLFNFIHSDFDKEDAVVDCRRVLLEHSIGIGPR